MYECILDSLIAFLLYAQMNPLFGLIRLNKSKK